MNAQRRRRPLMSIKEVFSIPQIILLPAMLVSCAIIALSFLTDPVSTSTAIGAAFATFVFGALVFFVLVVPAIYAFILKQSGRDGTATIIKKEKRSRTLITADYNTISTSNYVTFEFVPQGTSTPIRIEAEVGKVSSKLTEGKTAKIRYAASNPRIVKFIGE